MLTIVDYSERAIAVIGTERGNQEQITALKGMKGKYNPSLRCGKGWVFSKAKNGEQVKAWVAMWNAAHPQTETPQPSAPKSQPTPAPAPASSPEPTPQAVEQPAPQTIQPAPATISIPIIEDELEGAPF
jgi:DNA polymerase III gamma/tau subunit